MKEYITWALTFLILSGLLSFSSVSPAEEGKWTKKADMPTKRDGLATSVVNGKIYTIGGLQIVAGVGLALPIVEEYNPETDKWTKKIDMPTARHSLGASVVRRKIYAIGGLSDKGFLSIVEEYDPVANKWTKKANMPTARWGLSTSMVNGKIYALGGTGGNSIVEEYDPETDKWTRKADMPTPRDLLSTSAVKGKVYAIGGWMNGPLSTVEEYNPVTDTWTKKTDMPTPRWGLATSVVNGKIYAIGGTHESRAFSTVEEYDPELDRWMKKPDMPTARAFLSTSSVNGKIYAIGGSGGLSTVEEYDTGFEDLGVDAKGKLVTSWGKIKSNHESLKKHE